ncbi:MAG TPA: MFS transporter [Rhodospirillales bacterium]|nr:MFS transporter [Rhodospirillales bacterium]
MDIFRYFRGNWRTPEVMLILMSIAMPLSFSTWMALINNFAIERAAFTGVEIGILQSLREIPGFLAFAVVFLLLLFREQTLGLVSLLLLGIGVAITGALPTVVGLYATTVLMSIGFHYYETVRQSLALQWIGKEEAPHFLGQLIAVGSFAGLISFGLIWLGIDMGDLQMKWIYLLGGGMTVAVTLFCWIAFPNFNEKIEQHKKLFLRKRYWLYYLITLMAGARRQIFVVFAGFLLVEKFGFDVATITLVFLANGVLNMYLAPKIGKLISHWGERRALTLEYTGLICVFVAYAFVDTAWIAVGLYIIDHLFFSMAIAINTYFQKIADPADMASQAGVAFSINHVAAVAIPALFGFIWLISPSIVFLVGAGMSFLSLILVRLIPENPSFENVALIGPYRIIGSAAE